MRNFTRTIADVDQLSTLHLLRAKNGCLDDNHVEFELYCGPIDGVLKVSRYKATGEEENNKLLDLRRFRAICFGSYGYDEQSKRFEVSQLCNCQNDFIEVESF